MAGEARSSPGSMPDGDRLSSAPPARARTTDALIDGAIAGLVAALVLVAWSLVLDLATARALPTFVWAPAIVIERLAGVSGDAAPTPLDVGIGMLFMLLGCVVLGAGIAWLLSLMRRTPTTGITLTVSFAALQLAFFAFDGASGAGLFARMRPWAVVGGNALAAGAMTTTLWKRRPRLIEGRRDLWDEEP